MSQVKEFSAFLCMGRCKSLGSLKSFLWYAPRLSGASVRCFLRAPLGSGCSLMAARWQVFFVSFLSSLRAHQLTISGGCNCLWLWHPLFTGMAGSILFLTFNTNNTKILIITTQLLKIIQKGRGKGEGQIKGMGLTDTNYYI